MKYVEQKVVWYRNDEEIRDIYNDVSRCIADGWRVHTCLERGYHVLVVYERDLETWN